MISVEEARARVVAMVGGLLPRPESLAEAVGLVLAEDVVAGRDLPGFDNSAMDGFAVQASDTAGASPDAPVSLRLAGEIAAGATGAARLAAGTAVGIMTGAPLPLGADAVVEVEETSVEGARVDIRLQVSPGRSVRRAGEDTRRGQLALPAGTWLGAPQLALLAALGTTLPVCVPRPRVAVIATGDELVDPDVEPGPGQVADIVSSAIAAAVSSAGGVPVAVPRAGDTETDVRRALADAVSAKADLVVSVGGVSMGRYDHVRQVIEAEGELDFWRVAMRPGKPLAVGRVGGTVVIGLPGNPVSALVGFEVYVVPVILAMSGRAGWARPRLECILDTALESAAGLRTFVRARVSNGVGGPHAEPVVGQGSHQLRAMASANALLDIPEVLERVPAGEIVEAILLENPPGPVWRL